MQAAYTWAIEDALRSAAIEMPFPQMDVRLRSLFGREEDSAIRTLGLHAHPRDEAVETAAPSRNDAAEDTVADKPPEDVAPSPA